MTAIYGEEQRKQIIADYLAGRSLRAVANKYYVSYATIKHYMEKAGIARRSCHERTKWVRNE